MPKTKKIQLNKKWVYRNAESNFSSDKLNSEIIYLLSARGIQSEKEALEFLNPDYNSLGDPFSLLDMQKAVDVIKGVIESNEKITIYGDYDVDGITATALLYSFFKEIGVVVETYIPSRQSEGYGLNTSAIEKIAENGTKLIITVDCGSTSVDEIRKAKELGLKIVVTDHHTLKQNGEKDILPSADAVINPKRIDSKYSEELAGVGVAFYLARALQTVFTDKLKDGQEKWLLDLVALGTICDVVPLVGDNRILASFGLKVLSKSKRPGIKALSNVSDFLLKDIEAYHVGFLLGPRLNASGRLENAKKSLELLISENEKEAMQIAAELNEINKKRQELTEEILQDARKTITEIDDGRNIFLLASEKWPAGVVGIVASRLVEEYSRPVLIMEDMGNELKGSARSIKSFNIVNALADCKELLSHFGGHAFAAGFSLQKDHFILLNEKLIEIANKQITAEDLQAELTIDKEIEISTIDFELLEEIKKLEPYGQGNPKPIFALKNQEIKDLRFVGNPPIHLKLVVGNENVLISGMIFNFGEEAKFQLGDKINVAVTLEENIWRDKKSIEFRGIDIKTFE